MTDLKGKAFISLSLATSVTALLDVVYTSEYTGVVGGNKQNIEKIVLQTVV